MTIDHGMQRVGVALHKTVFARAAQINGLASDDVKKPGVEIAQLGVEVKCAQAHQQLGPHLLKAIPDVLLFCSASEGKSANFA